MTFGVGQRAIVIDASVAVEVAIGAPAWISRWEAWIDAGAMLLVPPHFAVEAANALLRGVRMGATNTVVTLEDLVRAGVETADRGLAGIAASVRLAELHGLTVYDAAYLDLAIDVDGELATLDTDLRQAAEAEGVSLISRSG